MLYVAWTGDSEALLAKRGRVFRLVEPHKADREVYMNVSRNDKARFSYLNILSDLRMKGNESRKLAVLSYFGE